MSNKLIFSYNDKYKPLNIKSLNTIIITKLSTYMEPSISTKDYTNYTKSNPLVIKELSCSWRKVYKITLDTTLKYLPGDSLSIISPNPSNLVNNLITYLGIENDTYYIERKGLDSFNYTGSIKDFFKLYFDFTSLPKKAFLYDISKNSENRKYLEYLCSKEGTRDYTNLLVNWNTVLDILQYFNLKPSLRSLLENCQLIRPRYFSLTNKQNDLCEVYIAITEKEINSSTLDSDTGNILYGHCSNSIMSNEFTNLLVKVQENRLLQIGNSKKILCLCTGTGVAPFISFIRNKLDTQKIKVIYGFRNLNDDLLSNTGVEKCKNTEIIKVMSCTQTYITDYIVQNKDELSEFTKQDCAVYVCGRPEMERDVYKIYCEYFVEIVNEKRLFFDDWH